MRQRGDLKAAQTYYESAIAEADAANLPALVACIQLSEADVVAARGDLVEAHALYRALAAEDQRVVNSTHVSAAAGRMKPVKPTESSNAGLAEIETARTQRLDGHLAASKESLLRVLKKIDQVPIAANWTLKRTVCSDMASLLAAEGDSQGAKQYLQKGLDSIRENKALTSLGWSWELMSMGSLAALDKDPQAEVLFRMALNRCDAHDADYPIVLSALAKLEAQKGNQSHAKRLLAEAISHWKMRFLFEPAESLSPDYHDALKLYNSMH
jgi:tetratricopeptide (TPR) repeat protein